jgi:hypothetical protein
VEVSDARKPRVVAEIAVPPHTHSHKVRMAGDVMTVNYERAGDAGVAGTPADATFAPGLKILDVSRKDRPKEIGFFRTTGMGVHRYDMSPVSLCPSFSSARNCESAGGPESRHGRP